MKAHSALLVFGCLLHSIQWASAAAGDVDPSFDAGSLLNREPYAIALQPDGKILIGGSFTSVPGLVRNRIARLNPDGTGDPTFDPGTGANAHVRSIVLQPDGRILVGGWFQEINGVRRNGIARLNPDGSLDMSFDPLAGADNLVFSLSLQPDGKVVVGGYFTHLNNVPRNHLARLHADGSLDLSFNASADNYVFCTLLQPDGKILVGGNFNRVNGTNNPGVTRLHPNGALDPTFTPAGNHYFVTVLALQQDGKLLVGDASSLVRLNGNGSVDSGFSASVREIINSIVVQPDGKVLIGGQFNAVNNEVRSYLARLHPNGTTDRSFNPPIVGGVALLAIEPPGTILVSGGIYTVDGGGGRSLVRLNPDGSLADSMNTSTGIAGAVYSIGLQSSNKLMIGGYFGDVNGRRRQGIARLYPDGHLDESFDPGRILKEAYYSLSNPVVYALAVQDERTIIGGAFTNINHIARNNIARLNENGGVDPSFDPGSGPDGYVSRLILQADGKVLIAGNFSSIDGFPRRYLARLNSNGSLDHAFAPAINDIPSIGLQRDRKILVAGSFLAVNGVSRKYLARLNLDGTLDTAFVPPDFNAYLSFVKVLSDDKIIVGGGFTRVGQSTRKAVARLNPDGTLDATFDTGAGPDGPVAFGLIATVAEQLDGKLLVWGMFTNFGGLTHPGLARLNLDGSVDSAFHTPTGLSQSVYCAAVLPDSTILIGGYFSTVDGFARATVTRLFGDGPSITEQPTNSTVFVGRSAVFTVNATGAPTLKYQWYHNGMPLTDRAGISGSSTQTLGIRPVQFRDAGTYSVVVSNAFGSISSDEAVLNVTAPGRVQRGWVR